MDRAVTRNRRIDDGVLAQILGAGFHDEREEGEVDTPLVVAPLRLAPQLRDTREIDLKEARDVRGHALRHHHVIGGDLANLGPRLDAVTGPRVDGRMLDTPGGSRERGAGSSLRRSAFNVSEDILFGHTTRVPAARDARDVDAVLGGDLADERRRLGAETLFGCLYTATITVGRTARRLRGRAAGRPVGRRGRGSNFRRFGFGRRWGRSGRLGWLRFRGRGQRRPCFRFQDPDKRLHRHRLPFLDLDLRQHPGDRRGNLGVDLVGRDFEERLVPFDGVADFLEPFAQGALGDGLAHLRHQHVNACHVLSKAVSSISPATALLSQCRRFAGARNLPALARTAAARRAPSHA